MIHELKQHIILSVAALAGLPLACLGQNTAAGGDWGADVSVYLIGPRMDGSATVAGITTEVDVPFSKIWQNLNAAGMGRAAVRYKRWGLSTDLVFMGLSADRISNRGGVDVSFDQWILQPVVEYEATSWISPYAGARYVDLTAGIRGPLGRFDERAQTWWDPVVGAEIRIPATAKIRLRLRGDVGGFGAGSSFSGQLEPMLDWRVKKHLSLQLGYRLYYCDYKTGSGRDLFRYDITTQGLQMGATFHF
jgi:hypothetical protein